MVVSRITDKKRKLRKCERELKRAHGNLTGVAERRKKIGKGQERANEYATSRTDKRHQSLYTENTNKFTDYAVATERILCI